MKNIPIGLIYLRLILGFVIILISILNIENLKTYAVFLLTIGLLTDIFDGIIARKLNISTQKLRRLDSTIDQVFFVSVIASAYIQCPEFFKSNALLLYSDWHRSVDIHCLLSEIQERNRNAFHGSQNLDARAFCNTYSSYLAMQIAGAFCSLLLVGNFNAVGNHRDNPSPKKLDE